MMVYIFISFMISIVCLLPKIGYTEIVLCGNATKLAAFNLSTDPTRFPCPEGFVASIVSKANTEAQRAILQGNPQKYLKVVGGLAVVMTQAEKDAVDAPLLAEEAARQALLNEVSTNTLCNVGRDLSLINTRLDAIKDNNQANIDAITNIATAKTALTDMNTINTAIFKQIARCLIARVPR